MRFIILPESEKRQWKDRTGHDLPDHTRQVFPAACVREPPPSRMDSQVSRNVQTWMWQGQLEFGPMRALIQTEIAGVQQSQLHLATRRQ